jgi:hypothetical protein
MTRSSWAAVWASVFVFALTPAVALAASPDSAAAAPATTHANPDSHSVPIIHRVNAVHTLALVHPKRRARAIKRRLPRSAARAVAQRHVVVLLSGSGYRQAGGSGRVRVLQRRLAALGFSPGPIDGRYGPLTTQAAERFQSAHRLTVNGIIGARTLRALGTVGRRFTPTASPKGHPTAQPHPVVPEGLSIPARSVPAKRPPALPVALVLLALAALGVSTMSLSYGRTRSRVRRKPARGEQKPRGLASQLVSINDANGGNGGHRR